VKHDKRKPPREPANRSSPISKDAVLRIARAAVEACDAEPLELTYGPGDFLRVVVDRAEPPIDTDLLVRVIRELHSSLREDEIDPGDMRIEVDSPGERRVLTTPEHFTRFRGERIRVTLTRDIDGRDHLVGRLLTIPSAHGGAVDIEDDNGTRHSLGAGDWEAMRLHPLQEVPARKTKGRKRRG